MNKRERELARLEIVRERAILSLLRSHYQVALDRVNAKIDNLSERTDLSGIRQRRYQEELAEQIGDIISDLGRGCYDTMEDYLAKSYEDGFVGTLYNLQGQGIPLAFPIDQRSAAKAIDMTATGVKLSDRVYGNVDKMQRQVVAEITRGFADGSHVSEIADRIATETDIATEIKKRVAGRTDQALRRAMTIARTEKGRVLSESRLEAMHRAKEEGADVVKQWDATMDSRTREDHRKLNGQIRELDEDFEIRGVHGPAPHKMGRPEHDINCRCVCLQRARAALEMPEGLDYTKWDGVSQCYVDLSDLKSYQEFKERYDSLARDAKNPLSDRRIEAEREEKKLDKRINKAWDAYTKDRSETTYDSTVREIVRSISKEGLADAETGAKPLGKELLTARTLTGNGHSVLFRATSGGYKEKNPDVVLDGSLIWDFKRITSPNPSKIYNRLKESKGQAENFVIDISLSEMNRDEALRQARAAIASDETSAKRIILLDDGKETLLE